MERERFKKLFPHLADEIDSERSKAQLNDYYSENDDSNRGEKRKWAGYDPDVIDFIRRCVTIKQAIEVIDYLERREEINTEQAVEIRRQLAKEGLRSFGTKKGKDFYYNNR